MNSNNTKLNEIINVFKSGERERALKQGLALSEFYKKNQHYYNTMGIFYRSLFKYDLAIECYNKAITIDPKNPAFYNNLGNAQRDAKNIRDSIKSFKKAIDLNSSNSSYWLNLSKSFNDLNLSDSALKAANNSFKIHKSADALNNIGIAFQHNYQFKQAQDAYKAGLRLDPENAILCTNLGKLIFNAGQHAEGIALLEKSKSLDPSHITSFYNLCECYDKTNNLDRFKKTINEAISKFKYDDTLLIQQAQLEFRQKKFKTAEKTLKTIRVKDISISKKIIFLEILGKTCEKLKKYSDAYKHFKEMNVISQSLNQNLKNSKSTYLKDIRRVRASFKSQHSINFPLHTFKTKFVKPTFMVGFPRSGTTLLDSILRSHPSIEIAEEQPLVEKIKNKLGKLPTYYNLINLKESELDKLRDLYIRDLNSVVNITGKTKVVIDKFPLNLVHAGLIWRIFPDSKFIFSLRHPCDCVLSCFTQNFKLNDAMTNFITLKNSANFYHEIMSLWNEYEKKLPLLIHNLKYEDLVCNLKENIEPALSFLNLKWDDTLLDYKNTALLRGHINTPSYYQVIESLHSKSIDKWKNYLNQLSEIKPILDPWITKYKYQ